MGALVVFQVPEQLRDGHLRPLQQTRHLRQGLQGLQVRDMIGTYPDQLKPVTVS